MALLSLALPLVFYCYTLLALFEVSDVKLIEKIPHSCKGIMYTSICAYNKHMQASVKHNLYYSVILWDSSSVIKKRPLYLRLCLVQQKSGRMDRGGWKSGKQMNFKSAW